MRYTHVAFAFAMLSSSTFTGCASMGVVSGVEQKQLNQQHEGELLFLKQSVYAGRFYDDDRYQLVHARRFEELTYLLNAEGEPITPPKATEIIPAGTQVRVERIAWPDGETIFRRPLYTPRYTTWVYLRVARGRGNNNEITFERESTHIMLLPGGIKDAATFNEWFSATLTTTDPNPYLRSLPETQRVAIDRKMVEPGMDYTALTSALGFPDRIRHEQRGEHLLEVTTYGKTEVVLIDGIVQPTASTTTTTTTTTTTPTAAPAPAASSSAAEG
jgi:hypothetical protein